MFAVAVLALLGQGPVFPKSGIAWFDRGTAEARREGILSPYPGCLGFGGASARPASRYESAVALHAAVTQHLSLAETAEKGPSHPLERAATLRAVRLLPFYRQGALEFRKELTELGVEREFGIERIAAITARLEPQASPRERLFSDVPPTHWAARAVGDLRALGLLDGYPDGRFRG